MMQHPLTGLWRNADFVKLWIGQTISNAGSGITSVALPLTAVLALSATPAQMGILNALDGVAVLLIGLLAGVWVDRLRRRPVLIATDLGRALLLGSIPLAAFLHVLRIEQLYIVGALTGILTTFFNVADESFLPELIPQQDLVEGNSKLGASDSLAEITGPAVAGPLVQVVGGPLAILFDAVSFLCSALCIGLIGKPESPPLRSEQQQGFWPEITEGVRLIMGNPLLRALAGSASIFNFFGNFIGVLYILYIIRELGIAPIFVGFLIAMGGISALIGALVAQRVVQRLGLGPTIGVALFIYGVTGLLTPLAHGPVVLALSLLFLAQLGDASVSIYFIAEISLRQAIIPNHLLGRVNSSMQFLTRGLGPLGALLAGILGGVLGVRLTLLIGVLGVTASGLWLLFSPVRKHTGS
jgi:MFS family permease